MLMNRRMPDTIVSMLGSSPAVGTDLLNLLAAFARRPAQSELAHIATQLGGGEEEDNLTWTTPDLLSSDWVAQTGGGDDWQSRDSSEEHEEHNTYWEAKRLV